MCTEHYFVLENIYYTNVIDEDIKSQKNKITGLQRMREEPSIWEKQ